MPAAPTEDVEARRRAGAFYTPAGLVDRLVAACVPASGQPSVVDPACGDGAFLAGVRRHNPSAVLIGLELDPAAAAAAQRRIPGARILSADALADPPSLPLGAADAVVGNPPYVRARRLSQARRDDLRGRFDYACGQFDLTVPFVERALAWLRPGGRLGFVLPNKVLVAAYARRLRRTLRTGNRLVEVCDLASEEGAFGGACAYPVLVVVERAAAQPGDMVRVVEGRLDDHGRVREAASREVPLDCWAAGAPARADDDAEAAWGRADLPRLGDVAGAREAVHTGNVRRKLVLDRSLDGSCRPLLRGRDVRRWSVRWAGLYLHEGASVDRAAGEYANLPPSSLFEGPKVLLREIALRPTAAFDPLGHRCLNKAYVVRPHERPTVERSLALCALLNSTPFARLFAARYAASGLRGGHLQFKPQWLGTVPVPPLSEAVRAGLPALADRLRRGDPLEAELDRRVESLYGWTGPGVSRSA